MTRVRLGVLAGLVLLLAGPLACKKSESMAAPSDYYAGDDAGGYYADGVTATGAMGPSPDQAEREEVSNEYRSFEDNLETKSIAALDPDDTTKGNEGKQTSQSNKDDETEHGRHIVYTASLQLAVYEMDEVIEFAEDIPDRHGGWVQARYDYQITLRVPATKLEAVMAELATLGTVLGKTLQAADVTAEYTDLESRIAVLEQLHDQLLELLDKAKTVEDSLKVRQELERVRIELEAAKTRMRQLAELVGFSTLTLNLVQRGTGEPMPDSNDPFPWVDQLGVEATEFQ